MSQGTLYASLQVHAWLSLKEHSVQLSRKHSAFAPGRHAVSQGNTLCISLVHGCLSRNTLCSSLSLKVHMRTCISHGTLLQTSEKFNKNTFTVFLEACQLHSKKKCLFCCGLFSVGLFILLSREATDSQSKICRPHQPKFGRSLQAGQPKFGRSFASSPVVIISRNLENHTPRVETIL